MCMEFYLHVCRYHHVWVWCLQWKQEEEKGIRSPGTRVIRFFWAAMKVLGTKSFVYWAISPASHPFNGVVVLRPLCGSQSTVFRDSGVSLFCHVNPGYGTQVIRLQRKCLCPLSHLTGPPMSFYGLKSNTNIPWSGCTCVHSLAQGGLGFF